MMATSAPLLLSVDPPGSGRSAVRSLMRIWSMFSSCKFLHMPVAQTRKKTSGSFWVVSQELSTRSHCSLSGTSPFAAVVADLDSWIQRSKISSRARFWQRPKTQWRRKELMRIGSQCVMQASPVRVQDASSGLPE